MPHNNLFEKAYSDTVTRAMADNDLLTAALAGLAPLQTMFPDTSLGKQLNMVAKLIAARTNLGMRRQIFFCSVSGYDTHGDQLTGQANLLTELSQALNSFYGATVELGVASDVTKIPLLIVGYGFGASFVALFAQLAEQRASSATTSQNAES